VVNGSRRRRGAALLAALAGLLLLLLWRQHAPAPRSAPAPAPAAQADEPPAPAWAARAPEPQRPPEPPPPAQPPPPAPPIIDEVTVEKQEVCEGEENLISVKAHTPGGKDDAFLHYFIATGPGASVPVRAFLPPEGGDVPGPMQIMVFGRDNVVTATAVPRYTIKRCRPQRRLLLTARQMPNAQEELEIEARVLEVGPSPPLRVTAYKWSFGDLAAAVTKQPSVVHRFVPRDPDALYADYLVTCEAVGADGRSVVGRTPLSLRNTEAENLRYNNALVLSIELTPRFPELDGQGKVVQRVRLYHHRSAPVVLDRARITYVAADRNAAEPGRDVSVGEVLGTDEVPPGPGVERGFELDTRAHAGAIMVDYDLEGHTAEGIRAVAHFSVMRPPATPTAESGDEVVDPLLKQKILRARERLGKPFVNDEDLLQLERDGAFADLKAAAGTSEAGEETPAPAPLSASAKAGVFAKLGARR
jgi:hypothetical protein